MTLRESLRDVAAGLRVHPELFVLGGAIGLLQIGLFALVVTGLPAVAPAFGGWAGPVAAIVSLFAVLPLFVSLYELTLHPAPEESAPASIRRALATAARAYPVVLRTDALVGLASVSCGLAAAVGWYVLATAGRFVRYVASDPSAPYAMESTYLIVSAVVLGGFLGSFLVRFADVLAAFHDHDAVSAVARSAAAGRRHPLSLAGFVVLLAAVNLAALGALATGTPVPAAEPDGSTTGPALLAAAVAVNGVSVTVAGVLHAAFARHHAVPAAASPGADTASLRGLVRARSAARLALAVVLVVGLVSGAAAVRTLDPAVHSPPELSPIDTDDPDAAIQTAVATTAASNHRQVQYTRNASDPGDAYRVFLRAGYDYDDRQLYHYFVGEDGEGFGGFFADGTLATLRGSDRYDWRTDYESGPWHVIPAPSWALAGGHHTIASQVLPNADADGWRVVSANASTMVVRSDDPETIYGALGSNSLGGATPPLANESHVTAVVDRERGVLEEARFHLHSLETGQNLQYRVEYREVGTADLERPEPIRDRRLAERLWDAVYY